MTWPAAPSRQATTRLPERRGCRADLRHDPDGGDDGRNYKAHHRGSKGDLQTTRKGGIEEKPEEPSSEKWRNQRPKQYKLRRRKNGGGETALGDTRVLDLTGPLGLYCTKLLADLGADVIKIERPEGDPARSIGPFFHDDPHPEKSLYWFNLNTNKKSITLSNACRKQIDC